MPREAAGEQDNQRDSRSGACQLARSREKEPHLRIRRCEGEREVLIECVAQGMRWTTKVAESICGYMMINSTAHRKITI